MFTHFHPFLFFLGGVHYSVEVQQRIRTLISPTFPYWCHGKCTMAMHAL